MIESMNDAVVAVGVVLVAVLWLIAMYVRG